MSDPLNNAGLPPKQGLYDPRFEHDACGVGFVVNIKGQKSNEIIRQALTVLLNLSHRGARGSEPNTGDGAGLLFQLPHRFFVDVCADLGFALPAPGEYGVGMVFLPADAAQRQVCEQTLERIIQEEGQTLLGWRTVPTTGADLGATARLREPVVRQVFIGCNRDALVTSDDLAFERKLYVIRKRAENAANQLRLARVGSPFYFPSLSSRTIVYKGMLLSEQVESFYPDLADPRVESAMVLVHSRFSTNTFPSWERAHPYRYIIHNGEINTLRGNINWMHARQSVFASQLFGDDLKKILPVIDASGSDSAMFDNCLEFLHLTGRSLPHAAMMMIPEPWSGHATMNDERKAFYEYHATLMEPWDGPACIAFTDGTVVGAVLDRNGLRPARYYVTTDDLVVMASEVGVLDIPPERVVQKGRLEPGRMFLIDTAEGRIIADEELKHRMASEHPYREWLDRYLVNLEDLPEPPAVDHLVAENGHETHGPLTIPGAPLLSHEAIVQQQQAFGYNFETLRVVMAPMAKSGVEALGSMGNDTPLAVLSDQPQLLYNYFKQLFAQVTNPPIDAIREELVTSTEVLLGTELNLLDTQPQNCHQLRLKTPILTNEDLAKMRFISVPGFKSRTLPILFRLADGAAGLAQALEDLCTSARQALAEGVNVIILSDRGVNREMAAIPALLAVSGLHHYLIREELRTQVALVLESGEPREVHHFALLIGYGATAINPYLAYESIDDMIREGLLPDIELKKAEANYTKAASKGVVKMLSKMGISTMQSYCGAQIFEAVGLGQALIDKYFTWTPSRIGGIGLAEVFQEVQMRQQAAFPLRSTNGKTLDEGGDYQWRAEGERHLLNPETVHTLQKACRTGDYATYQGIRRVDQHPGDRAQHAARPAGVEARGRARAAGRGGAGREHRPALQDRRHVLWLDQPGGARDAGHRHEPPRRQEQHRRGRRGPGPLRARCQRRSAEQRDQASRLGPLRRHQQLPGQRQGTADQDGAGREAGRGRPVAGPQGLPLDCQGAPLDARRRPDLAAPAPRYLLHRGSGRADPRPEERQPAGAHQRQAGLGGGRRHDRGRRRQGPRRCDPDQRPRRRHRRLAADQHQARRPALGTGPGRDAPDPGAEQPAQPRGAGDRRPAAHRPRRGHRGAAGRRGIRLRHHRPGDARLHHDARLPPGHLPGRRRHPEPGAAQELHRRPRASGQFHALRRAGYARADGQLGFRTVNEMIGRTDKLEPRQGAALVEHWKAGGLDFSNILFQPDVPESVGRYCQVAQDHGLDNALDVQVLLDLCEPALERGEAVRADLPIRNVHRVVGTILGSELTRRYGEAGLPDDTIHLKFNGSAGQSFGAFVPAGITLELEGDANDYFGKGLSGGKMIVYPPEGSTFAAEENVIIGNVAFYGATGGEAYVRGLAGERFCVRNSGVNAVVEGVGDHGCEYMTGGRVVVLGQTGRNFAAGMSGGIAYVLDQEGDFAVRCNQAMVDLERLEDAAEIAEVKAMVQTHAELTGSALAWRVLLRWDELVSQFVKVMPQDYKRMLEAFAEMEAAGLSGDEAVMAAFELNKNDQARVSGN